MIVGYIRAPPTAQVTQHIHFNHGKKNFTGRGYIKLGISHHHDLKHFDAQSGTTCHCFIVTCAGKIATHSHFGLMVTIAGASIDTTSFTGDGQVVDFYHLPAVFVITVPSANDQRVWLPPSQARSTQSLDFVAAPSLDYAGRFSSVPPLAQTKRSGQSQRSKGPTQVPKAIPQPIKETLAPWTPTVSKYLDPIKVCRPTSQASSASKKRVPPRREATRSAVRYIICINIIVYFVWRHCMRQQICVQEKCKDDQCGHEICGEVQWMLLNTFNSKFNIIARRYWTLVTSSFSHFAPQNLLVNMLALAMFAPAFYTAAGVGVGASHIMGLTLGSAIFSNLTGLVYRWNKLLDPCFAEADDTRAHWSDAGASGVANTFATAATYLAPRRRIAVGRFRALIRIYWVTMFIVISDLMALGNDDGVGHEVHLAGAAFGLAYYLFVLRRPFGWW
jgi:membrane associated rhomboid family serine protease